MPTMSSKPIFRDSRIRLRMTTPLLSPPPKTWLLLPVVRRKGRTNTEESVNVHGANGLLKYTIQEKGSVFGLGPLIPMKKLPGLMMLKPEGSVVPRLRSIFPIIIIINLHHKPNPTPTCGCVEETVKRSEETFHFTSDHSTSNSEPEISSYFMEDAKKLKTESLDLVSCDDNLFFAMLFVQGNWDISSIDAFLNQDSGNVMDLWSFDDLPNQVF